MNIEYPGVEIIRKDDNYYALISGKKYKVSVKYAGAKNQYSYYRTKLPTGTNPVNHRSVQRDITGTTLDDLAANISQLMRLSDQEMRLIDTDMTVEELISKFWDNNVLFWDKSTVMSYQSARNNLENDCKFMHTLLKDITDSDVINWQRCAIKRDTLSQIDREWIILHSAMNYAVTHRYIPHDPCRYTKIFNYKSPGGDALSEQGLYRILYLNRDNRFASIFAVTLLGALRISETLGLCWNDIDEKEGTILIHQQCAYDRSSKEYHIKPCTKNRRSRTIYPPRCIFWYLRRQLEIQRAREENEQYNNRYGLVFTDVSGEPLSRSVIGNELKNMLAGTVDEGLSLHDLRSTAATYGYRLSGDLDAVQYYLGHKYKRTLLDYIASDDNSQLELANLMDGHFRNLFS